MNVEEYARWMREEHERCQDLAQKLRERIGIVPKAGLDGVLKDVRDRFEHIRAHLTRHIALEERGGYMALVLAERPSLSREVERLRHHHGEFTRLMTGIFESLSMLTGADRLLIRDTFKRIELLLSYIEEHEAQENLIALSAFTDDIGTKD